MENLPALLEIVSEHPKRAECYALIGKLCSNIVTNPSEVKYRSVKTSNPKLRESVFDVPAAEDILQAAGWVDNGDSYQFNGNIENLSILAAMIGHPVIAPVAPAQGQTPPVAPDVLDERAKRAREIQKKQMEIEEEKRKIKEQIKSDQQLTHSGVCVGSSHAQQAHFGSRMATMRDVKGPETRSA